jgi:putative peptide zinc metalloprotease protein
MSAKKISVSLAVLAAVVAAGLFLPIPLHLDAAFTIEPHAVRHVYTQAAGELAETFVKPGQRVEEGQPLVKLSNVELDERHRDLKLQKELLDIDVSVHRALDEPTKEQLTATKRNTVEQQLAETESQIERLISVAPIAGVVVDPPRMPQPTLEQLQMRLNGWHGTPLEGRNTRSYLERSTHLLSIAPDDKFQAVLLVDQSDRKQVFVGQDVKLKLSHLPDRVYRGKVAAISERHREYAPQALSNKSGGDLPTVTDQRGQERLPGVAYQATVVLDQDPGLQRPGLRGWAKFLSSRSAADWIWAYLCRMFRFRL